MTRKPPDRIALVAVLTVIVLTFAPAAIAGRGGGGHGGSGGTCTRAAPRVSVDNTWGWGAPGSWGLPGQQLTYAIDVFNNDVACGSSSFAISIAAPGGFAVSIPTNTITLKSASTGYVWAQVTSPNVIADGTYPLTVTVDRVGGSSPNPYTTYYKVYSTDVSAPTMFWPNPDNGETITASSYGVVVSSNDDHAVKKIDLYIDNVYRSTTVCDGIAYTCQLYYNWSLRGVQGHHTTTFKSSDWMGNVSVLTTSFTVN